MNGINLLKADGGNGGATFYGAGLARPDERHRPTTRAPITIAVANGRYPNEHGRTEGTHRGSQTRSADSRRLPTALGGIEAMHGQLAVEAAATLGAAAENIASQREFVGELTNALNPAWAASSTPTWRRPPPS